jgi:hypothetical protein
LEYQLVLQVLNVASGDFERLLRWEKSVAECLPQSATVDGHDLGLSEFNIFIDTDNPEATFRAVLSCKENAAVNWPTTAAYRLAGSEDYIVVWPPGRKEFNVA